MQAKADLHVHSKYSDRPSEWILRRGAHRHAGAAGTSLRLAHSFYHIGYGYYKNRFLGKTGRDSKLLETVLQQMTASAPTRSQGIKGTVAGLLGKAVRKWQSKRLSPLDKTLVNEFSSLFDSKKQVQSEDGKQVNSDEYTFELACQMTHRIGYHFLQHFTAHLQNVSLLESLQTISSLGPVALSITPYLTAFRTQHKDEKLLQEFTERFNIADPLSLPNPRKVWIADTFAEGSTEAGLAASLNLAADGAESPSLKVITCLENPPRSEQFQIVNFEPAGMFELSEYSKKPVPFPPFLKIVEYCEREQFEEIIISSPGPLGLTALAAARLLGVKATGICSTDFPESVGEATADETLRQLAWRYTSWFYGQVDKVMVSSTYFKDHLHEGGLNSDTIEVIDSRSINQGELKCSVKSQNPELDLVEA
ncbi:MAG: glycosyltransferase [Lentisphaeria bacterium]